MRRLNNKGSACIFVVLIIAFGSWFGWAIHNVESNSSIQQPTQTVTFVNTGPGTILGLAKFVVDKKGNPIDYEILHERWTEKNRVLQLESGYYGVTQYGEFINLRTGIKRGWIISYHNFWVKDKPVLVIM